MTYQSGHCSSGELLKMHEFYILFEAGDSRVFRIDSTPVINGECRAQNMVTLQEPLYLWT